MSFSLFRKSITKKPWQPFCRTQSKSLWPSPSFLEPTRFIHVPRSLSKTYPLNRLSPFVNHLCQLRLFQSDGAYHNIADETLEELQDAVEHALEDSSIPDFEIVLANGVLTLTLPPHGTWVINKQTPNRQLWWSSPISGPRRYEYENGDWVFTRDESHSTTLRQSLKEEIKLIYEIDVDFESRVA